MRFKNIDIRFAGAQRRGRRALLSRLAALGAATALPGGVVDALAQAEAAAAASGMPLKRRALVLGNTSYQPERQSIPSSRKNATDVADALKTLGFEVRREVDQGGQAMRALVQDFFAQARADRASRALAVFYYSGHGIQHRAQHERQTFNYIVPSDVNLGQRVDAIAKASINVDKEVIGQNSLPNDGTSVLIFDACRNDPGNAGDRAGSFNQVVPPPGTLITFSTAPGKYAIAPKSPDENSIYTKILVRELQKANADMLIKDFLDNVKFEVRRYMEQSDEEFLRKHAQDPEVAANLRLQPSFALEKVPDPIDAAEQAAWAAIERAELPADRIRLLKEFIENFKGSRFLQSARVQLERASLSEAATRRNQLDVDTVGDAQFRDDQRKGLDGDKDAAYRVAMMYKEGSNGVRRSEDKMVQWLKHASDLKSGIASWELSLYYITRGRDVLAKRYENLALAQGYTPPPRFDPRRG
jgi:hypothetical protein